MAKNIPNIITLFRILFAIMLLVMTFNNGIFLCVYILCAVTDVLDGYIARKYSLTTKLGARLDSLADGTVAVVIVVLLFQKNLLAQYAGIMAAVVLIRLINLALTCIRFKQCSMLHTIGNKATGMAIFLAVPYYYCVESLPLSVAIILGVLATVSSLEETILILSSTSYNSDEKGILWNMAKK